MKLTLEYLKREITRDALNKMGNVVPGQQLFGESKYELYFEENDGDNPEILRRNIEAALTDSYISEKNNHQVRNFIEGRSNCFSWRFDDELHSDDHYYQEQQGSGWKWKNYPPLGMKNEGNKKVDPRLVISDIIEACMPGSGSSVEGLVISKVIFYDEDRKMELITDAEDRIPHDDFIRDHFSFKEVRRYDNDVLSWTVRDASVFFPYRSVTSGYEAFKEAFPPVLRGSYSKMTGVYEYPDGNSQDLYEVYQRNLIPCTTGSTGSGTLMLYGEVKYMKDQVIDGYPINTSLIFKGLFLWEETRDLPVYGNCEEAEKEVLKTFRLFPLFAEKKWDYDYNEDFSHFGYMYSLSFMDAFENRLFRDIEYTEEYEIGSLGFEENTLFWTFRYNLPGDIYVKVKYNAGRRETPVIIGIFRSMAEIISYNCVLTSLINADGLARDVLTLTDTWDDAPNVSEDWKNVDYSEELNPLLIQLVNENFRPVSSDNEETEQRPVPDAKPATEDALISLLKNKLYGPDAEDSKVIDTLSVKMVRWLPLIRKADYENKSMRDFLKNSRNLKLPPIGNYAIMGEPGTGKTTLARRLAENCFGAYFRELSSGGLTSYYVGGTEKLIATIILQMKKETGGKSPCVLFLDEAYTLFESKKEGAKGTGDAVELILNLASPPEERKPVDLSKLSDKDKAEIGLPPKETSISIPDYFYIWIGGYKDRLSISFQSNPGLNRRFTKLSLPSPKTEQLWSALENNMQRETEKLSEYEYINSRLNREEIRKLLANCECEKVIKGFIRWATTPSLAPIFGNYAGIELFAENIIDRLLLSGADSIEKQKQAVLKTIQDMRLDIKERYKYSLLQEIENPPFEAVTDIEETFENYKGNIALKSELCDIIDMMVDETDYRKRGIDFPKGALLMGPPGTGKTFIARCMAGELQKRLKERESEKTTAFFPVSAAELLNTGNPVKVISALFSSSDEYDYVIIFIDEIDAIGKHREMQSNIAPLIQLMKEMDGFTERNNLFVLAATNSPESLDPALKREGRFDLQLEVGIPDRRTSEDLFKMYLKKHHVDYDDFTPEQKEKMIRMLAGHTPAQVKADLNEAVLMYYRIQNWLVSRGKDEERIDFIHRIIKNNEPGKSGVTTYLGEDIKPGDDIDVDLLLMDLKETLDVRYIGNRNAATGNEWDIETLEEFVKASDKRPAGTAVHETGHALIKLLKGRFDIERITVLSRGDILGYIEQKRTISGNRIRKKDLLDSIMVCMGGRAAEEVIFGTENAGPGAVEDIRMATAKARTMVTLYGFSEDIGFMALGEQKGNYLGTGFVSTCSESFRLRSDEAVAGILKKSYDETKKLLEDNRELLERMSFAVYKKLEMSGDELLDLFNTIKGS